MSNKREKNIKPLNVPPHAHRVEKHFAQPTRTLATNLTERLKTCMLLFVGSRKVDIL